MSDPSIPEGEPIAEASVPQPQASPPPRSKSDAVTTLLAAGLGGAYKLQQAFYQKVPGGAQLVSALIDVTRLHLSLHHKLLHATVAQAAKVGFSPPRPPAVAQEHDDAGEPHDGVQGGPSK